MYVDLFCYVNVFHVCRFVFHDVMEGKICDVSGYGSMMQDQVEANWSGLWVLEEMLWDSNWWE